MAGKSNIPLTEKELDEVRRRIMAGEDSDENMEVEYNSDPYADSGSSFRPSSDDEGSDINDNNVIEDIEVEEGEDTSNQNNQNNDNDGDVWTDTDDDPVIYNFRGREGLKINLPENASCLDIFSVLFDETLIDKIINWTNARAELLLKDKHLKRTSNMNKWKATDAAEIKQFLGLCIVMGNIRMPSLKLYWSKNILYNHPLCGRVMSRNRFETILRCLCFYSELDDKSDRLHKIDQVVEHIIANITKTYSPGENLSLDEALLLWRGRLSFRQYIPNKSSKYGIKLYELCTPDGFVLNFLIYAGKGTVDNENGHAQSVVIKLTQAFLGKGHTLYMDNYYNSVQLANFLSENETHVVGTLRKNRKGNPKKVISTKLAKGEVIFQRKGNMIVQKWKDKREVLMISTRHKGDLAETENKRGEKKTKPMTVIDYNKNMSGVDRCDQMLSYYSSPRKTVRWYLKLFFHLFDITIWNACWLQNKITPTRKKSYLQFRDAVALGLLAINKEAATTAAAAQTPHYPKKVEKRKRCRECSKSSVRALTWYICEMCKDQNNEPIGLCIDPCFKRYHTCT